MYINKKSLLVGTLLLYLSLFGCMYLDADNLKLKKQLAETQNQIDFVKLQNTSIQRKLNEIEGELDEISDNYDNLSNEFAIYRSSIPTLEEVQEDDLQEEIIQEIAEGEIEMLAQLVEAEAGNQDFKGKCLVADVVLNRVASDIFPDTVEDVIMEHHIRKSDGVDCYQFSTVKYGTFDEAAWHISDESFAAAKQEYENARIDDKILYFTAGYYNPCCVHAYQYGDHYFGT